MNSQRRHFGIAIAIGLVIEPERIPGTLQDGIEFPESHTPILTQHVVVAKGEQKAKPHPAPFRYSDGIFLAKTRGDALENSSLRYSYGLQGSPLQPLQEVMLPKRRARPRTTKALGLSAVRSAGPESILQAVCFMLSF